MNPAPRHAAFLAMGLLLALASTAHAAWQQDGTLVAPEVGALVATDGRGGMFDVTDLDLYPRLYHVRANGDSARGVPSSGLDLVPHIGLNEHEAIFPITVLPDGQGGTFILTEEQGPNGGDGGFLDPVQLYLHRRTADGQPARGWTAQGVLIESARLDHRIQGNNLPIAIPDGRGGVLVAWLTGGGPDLDTHALVQRIGPDGASRWNPDGVDACGAGRVNSLPTLVADGRGGALVSWARWDSSGTRVRFFGQHLLASGEPTWGADGRLISRRSFDRVPGMLPLGGGSPFVGHAPPVSGVSDGEGGEILSWAAATGADLNIFATRITAAGHSAWRQDVVVCATPGEQSSVVSIAARHGGAILAWRDGRDSANVGVYAQHLSGEGRPRWARNGAPACVATRDRNQVVLADDDRDGAYLAWVDPPQGGRLFAQHLSESGRPVQGWPEQGTLVSGTANSYEGEGIGVQLVAAERGSVIASWSSARVGSLAMLLTPRGPAATASGAEAPDSSASTADVPHAPPALAFALHGVRPNPVVGNGVISFALPEAAHATLELLDIAGRRIWSREVGTLGAGEHSVSLGDGARIGRGVYFVRLSQGQRVATARATMLR